MIMVWVRTSVFVVEKRVLSRDFDLGQTCNDATSLGPKIKLLVDATSLRLCYCAAPGSR